MGGMALCLLTQVAALYYAALLCYDFIRPGAIYWPGRHLSSDWRNDTINQLGGD